MFSIISHNIFNCDVFDMLLIASHYITIFSISDVFDMIFFCKGVIVQDYNEEFKKYRQLSLSILKQFGFGQNILETRISLEVGQLTQYIKALNGQVFDPQKRVMLAVQNIIRSRYFITGLVQQFNIRPPEGLDKVECKE